MLPLFLVTKTNVMHVILVFLFLLYWYFLASASIALVLNEVECEGW